jgi:hypothetical protein
MREYYQGYSVHDAAYHYGSSPYPMEVQCEAALAPMENVVPARQRSASVPEALNRVCSRTPSPPTPKARHSQRRHTVEMSEAAAVPDAWDQGVQAVQMQQPVSPWARSSPQVPAFFPMMPAHPPPPTSAPSIGLGNVSCVPPPPLMPAPGELAFYDRQDGEEDGEDYTGLFSERSSSSAGGQDFHQQQLPVLLGTEAGARTDSPCGPDSDSRQMYHPGELLSKGALLGGTTPHGNCEVAGFSLGHTGSIPACTSTVEVGVLDAATLASATAAMECTGLDENTIQVPSNWCQSSTASTSAGSAGSSAAFGSDYSSCQAHDSITSSAPKSYREQLRAMGDSLLSSGAEHSSRPKKSQWIAPAWGEGAAVSQLAHWSQAAQLLPSQPDAWNVPRHFGSTTPLTATIANSQGPLPPPPPPPPPPLPASGKVHGEDEVDQAADIMPVGSVWPACQQPDEWSSLGRRGNAAATQEQVVQDDMVQSEALPSAGSARHHLGLCKPCAFVYLKGCRDGLECRFCHLCETGEKKRRKKERSAMRRATRERTEHVADTKDSYRRDLDSESWYETPCPKRGEVLVLDRHPR